MMKRTSSAVPLLMENVWDAVLLRLSAVIMASYLLLYLLVPEVYEIGPALLFILTIISFRWRRMAFHVDHETLRLIAVLLVFFLCQALTLVVHREDVSEFDLSTRYVAAAVVLLFLVCYSVNVNTFFLAVALGALASGVYGAYQLKIAGVGRVLTFDNPIHYGNGALGLALISLAGMSWAVKHRLRPVWLPLLTVAVLGGIYASLVSGTRSGWVAFPVVVLIGLFAYWKSLRRYRWAIPVLIAGVILTGTLISQVGVVKQRSQGAVDEVFAYYDEGRNNTSVGLRLDMWKAGLTAFKESPAIGMGPRGTDSVIDELISSGEIHPRVQKFRHLHNQYIDIMARYGLVGLASYLTLLAVSFGLFMKKSRCEVASVRALGLGGAFFVALHAVVNLTQSMLERNIGVMMFVFTLVFIWAVLKKEERVHSSELVAPEMEPPGDRSVVHS